MVLRKNMRNRRWTLTRSCSNCFSLSLSSALKFDMLSSNR